MMTKQTKKILSIGYGDRTLNDFLEILNKNSITTIIDVRSTPYSKYRPEYNKKEFKIFLQNNQIFYFHLGSTLGGIPNNPEFYTGGYVDYDKIRGTRSFKKGIFKLEQFLELDVKFALMCSEKKPEMCHRSKLIGVAMEQNGIEVFHIDEIGKLKSQSEVLNRIISPQYSLFHNEKNDLKSRNRYGHDAT